MSVFSGQPTLWSMCSDGDVARLKKWLANHRSISIDSADPFTGHSALIAAAHAGRLKACRLLLERGADPNFAEERTGTTALHLAAKNDYHKVVSLLIACGAEPTTKDEEGHTPLHVACESDRLDALVAMLASDESENAVLVTELGGPDAWDYTGRIEEVLADAHQKHTDFEFMRRAAAMKASLGMS